MCGDGCVDKLDRDNHHNVHVYQTKLYTLNRYNF